MTDTERAGSAPQKPRPVTYFVVPRDTEASKCRGCGALVFWIVTAKGKKMPVDTRVDGGLEPLRDRDGRGLSHFATCPKADRFRRRGAR